MTPIADIVAAAGPAENGFRAAIPGDWMQGRTAYGGLSAALALHAALALEPDLPPLRSAQVSFVGPLAGEVTVSATRLRRGRNAAFLQADVSGDAGLGLRATFVFMAPLASAVSHDAAPRSRRGPPGPGDRIRSGDDSFFIGNFEFVDFEDTRPAEWRRWTRLKAREGLHPMIELMTVADAMPPAAFKLFEGFVPLSTLDWMINFLTPEPVTQDGWWLLEARADTARAGYSSQRMAIWNAAGEPVAEALQGVAIFA